MTQLKQKTINTAGQSQTIALKKLKNTMGSGGKWMYVIVDKDTGQRLEDPFTNKRRAKQEFDRSVDLIRSGMESSAQDTRRGQDMGLGGGGSDDALFDDDDLDMGL